MLKKPDKCCPIGSYECQVPVMSGGRTRYVDLCIAPMVVALNAANIGTLMSCCGHDEQDGVIYLEDGRQLIIRAEQLPRNTYSSQYEEEIGID